MNEKTLRQYRKRKSKIFTFFCGLATLFSILILAVLIYEIVITGFPWLKGSFISGFPSRSAHKAGIQPALWGTLWVISLTALFSVPFGIATAIYLQEYSKKNLLLKILQINIANLAGMPSIVYGLLGLTIFVRFLHLDRSILAGSLTLGLLVLPIIIIASQEALKAVPNSIRYAASALGARKWQVVFGQTLPAAMPGIMTGVILALSRAIGETAPLIIIGALSYVAFIPQSMHDSFTTLPIQIFNWASRPQEDFHGIAASAILVLLTVLFTMNSIAVFIRHHYQRYK